MIEVKANTNEKIHEVQVSTTVGGEGEALVNEAYFLITDLFKALKDCDDRLYAILLDMMANDDSWAGLDEECGKEQEN